MTQFADYKIPVLDWSTNAGGYKNVPVDLQDSRANDPLVKPGDLGIATESFYARSDAGNWPYKQQIEGATRYVWCRRAVAERLVNVNRRLAPFEAEIFVLDGYRPVKCQEGLWKFFWEQARREMPQATEAEQREYVLNFVSDPTRFVRSDSKTWPVHTSGGAVDVTLRRIGSTELLDMGARFDEMSPLSYTDALERKLAANEIPDSDPSLRNRRLLHWAMTQEGFINYPFEFWHFDYGDQMYALHAKLLSLPDPPHAAWYGYAEPPSES